GDARTGIDLDLHRIERLREGHHLDAARVPLERLERQTVVARRDERMLGVLERLLVVGGAAADRGGSARQRLTVAEHRSVGAAKRAERAERRVDRVLRGIEEPRSRRHRAIVLVGGKNDGKVSVLAQEPGVLERRVASQRGDRRGERLLEATPRGTYTRQRGE